MEQLSGPAMGQSYHMLAAKVKLNSPNSPLGSEAGSVLQAGKLGS